MRTIFLVLPRRISVRYMLSSEFWVELKKKAGLRVVILTSINDPKFVQEFSDANTIIEVIKMRDGQENFIEYANRVMRSYLGIIGYDLETLNAKAKMRGSEVFWIYRFLVTILRPLLILRKPLRWLDVNLLSSWLDKDYEILFDRYKPDLVLIHSVQELTAVPVARVAQRRKVHSLGVVLSWDNLTNKGEIYARCDRLVVWNYIMQDHAQRYHGYRAEDVFVIGTPQFDFFVRYANDLISRSEFFFKMGLDEKKKLILHTTVPERIGGDEETRAIACVYEAIKTGAIKQAQLLVRIYTKDDPKRYKQFESKPGLILYDPGKDGQNFSYKEIDKYFFMQLAAMIKYADVVINIASTTSIDAAILNRPIINLAIGRQQYWYETSHYHYLVETGGVHLVHNTDDLVAAINQYLENSLLDEIGRGLIVSRIGCKIDGRAGKRLAEFVL